MPRKSSRARTWTLALLGAGLGLVAGLSGLAFAGVGLFNNLQTAQGQFVKSSGGVPGVSDVALLYTSIPRPAPSNASANAAALTALAMGPGAGQVDQYCAGPCTTGNFSEEFEFLITAPTAAEGFQMTISAAAGSHSVNVTIYFQVPATATGATTATLEVFSDLTAVSTYLSGTTALQLCSSATSCP